MKISFGMVTRKFDTLEPIEQFLDNAQKYGHEIYSVVIAYSDFLNWKLLESLKKRVQVFPIKINHAAFTLHQLSKMGISSKSIRTLLYSQTFVMTGRVPFWITPYATSQTDIPYVVTAHGTDLKGFKREPRYHPYALEGAKKVITIFKQVDKEVKNLYGIEDTARELILNGYDEALFQPMEISKKGVLKKFGIDSVPKYIVSFAGKLIHFKGVDVLLKAAKIYENNFPGEVTTLIVGNSELYDELNQLKNSLSLQNVFFLGHISQKSLADIYNIADVHVVPSRVEPFGLVAIEALACGTPVVGTNQGGLVDFIHPDVGKLVDVDDALALSEAIQEELKREDKLLRRKKPPNMLQKIFHGKKTSMH